MCVCIAQSELALPERADQSGADDQRRRAINQDSHRNLREGARRARALRRKSHAVRPA
jgi:hypothetical protein